MGVKISELSEAISVQETDVFPMVQNGETKKVPMDTMMNTIIETGENANGSYIKFFDGTMICSGTKQLTLNLTSAYEGAYYADTNDITFPTQFVGNPTITTGIYTNSSLISFNISAYDSSKFRGFVWKNQSKSNIPVNIYFTAVGKWK